MKKTILTILIISLITACNNNYPNLDSGLYAKISTKKGSIIIKLEM